MKMRGIALATCAMLMCLGCGGSATKKNTAEVDVRVKNEVEQLRYFDQVRDRLVEARLWELAHRGEIHQMLKQVEQPRVPKSAKLQELPEPKAVANLEALAKPQALDEASHAQLQETFEAYLSCRANYTQEARELAAYLAAGQYRRDGYKQGKELMLRLNELGQSCQAKEAAVWTQVEGLQNGVFERMAQDTPLAACYQALTQDVTHYKLVIEQMMSYRDGMGELKEAVAGFNALLESVYAHRYLETEALAKAGMKTLYEVAYAELSQGLRVLKEVIVELNYEGTEPHTVDMKLLPERYAAINQAYKQFLAE